MSDYSDLVQRLRDQSWVMIAEEAADAIEVLQRELKCANELWEQQKELALEYLADIEKANERIDELKEQLRIANNDFFNIEATTFDMKSRIAELEAALKPFDEELKNQELEVPHVIDGDSLIHNYGLRLRDFRSARAALEKKND